MAECKGRLTSDITGKGKVAFLNPDGSKSNKYYYNILVCKKECLKGSDLCGSCSDKEKKIQSCTVSKSGRLNGANHPAVLHGKVGESIPIWSHIEGGEWFKNMLQKGYRKESEMPVKEFDEAKIFAAIPNLKGLKNKMVEDLIKQFPELTKHSASNFITLYNKKNSKTVAPKKYKIVKSFKNVVEDFGKKLVIDSKVEDDVYDVVELKVKPITINGINYYYEPKKDKVYTLEYKYVGRYDTKNEKLCLDYPDSDSEPSFTS